MAGGASGGQRELTKGARITGDQRSSLAEAFGERYSGGESIRSIASDTGRSYGFVHGVLKESGASLRGRGGATRGPRRGPAGVVADQVEADAGGAPASPARTKARAVKDALKAAVGAEPGDAAEPAGATSADKGEKAGKSKAAKDDKAKKKADAKADAKKAGKGAKGKKAAKKD